MRSSCSNEISRLWWIYCYGNITERLICSDTQSSTEQQPHWYQQNGCSDCGFAGHRESTGVTTIFAVALTVLQENIECSRSHQTESFVADNTRLAHVRTTAEISPYSIHCKNKLIRFNCRITPNVLMYRCAVPFCRIFRHMVGRTPGKCSKSGCCLQSVIERVLLSNGSAHFGSASDRQSQHFMLKTVEESNYEGDVTMVIDIVYYIFFNIFFVIHFRDELNPFHKQHSNLKHHILSYG